MPPWIVLPEGAGEIILAGAHPPNTLSPLFHELNGGTGLAVRSSSRHEDQREHSGAGAYLTKFCSRPEGLPAAIAAVLDSAAASKGTAADAGMAVILQRQIQPALAGVIFSAHPSCARADCAYVELVEGSPVGLVNGTVSPYRATLDPIDGALAENDDDTILPPSFTPAIVRKLSYWLRRVERAMGCAVDIEWAVDRDGLWLLQARPITRLFLDPRLRPALRATSWFFDQRFAEPIRPLTRSSLVPLILRTGIQEALSLRRKAAPDPLVCDYAGQLYVALEAYHRLLSGIPFTWLTADLRQLFPEGQRPPRWLPPPTMAGEGLRILWQTRRESLFNLRTWQAFLKRLDRSLSDIPDADGKNPESWVNAWISLDALTVDFLKIHRWSIMLADGGYGLFRWANTWRSPESRAIRHRRLQARVRLVTTQANAARLAVEEARQADDAFIRRFGHRSASLDYVTPTWGEVYGHLDEPALPTTEMLQVYRRRRGWLPRLLELREEQRFVWEMILARQRRLLIRAALRLEERGLIGRHEDIWWMTWDEVHDGLCEGARPDGSDLERRERAHYVHGAIVRPPGIAPMAADDDARTERPVNSEQVSNANLVGLGASTGRVRGTALVATRSNEVPENLGDDIILVLPSLDPGCSSVMARACGLIIERGGLLSHAAILAREYGIPLVIGIPDVLDVIQNGDLLEIDGEQGTVTVVSPGTAPAE